MKLKDRKKSKLKRLLRQKERLQDKRFLRKRDKLKLKDLRNWPRKKIRKG